MTAMPLKPLKLVMAYDICCPHSWVSYQVLQKKLPNWRKFRQIDVEYKPAMLQLIHRMAHGVKPAGLIASKRKYFLDELYRTCDLYGIKKGNFDLTFQKLDDRSISALLLLLKFRDQIPEYYEKLMCSMWEEYWHKSGRVHRSTVFLRLGRELGIPFRAMDEIVLHTETRENYTQLSQYDKHLIEDERVIGLPWFTLLNDQNSKILSFSEVFRLELLDELMACDDGELARLAPIADEEMQPIDEEDNDVVEESLAWTDRVGGDTHYEMTLESNRLREFK